MANLEKIILKQLKSLIINNPFSRIFATNILLFANDKTYIK